jgi:hypothetical protein
LAISANFDLFATMDQSFINWIFQRELDKLISEIKAYPNDASLWLKVGSISNSAGNLVLHLAGNLNHFIGARLGNTGYQRKRDLEFSLTGLTKQQLVEQIEVVKKMLGEVLPVLSTNKLKEPYPDKIFDQKTYLTEEFLLHLLSHLSYHLGQINYHRRISTEK